jgi:hypothetical protein
MARLVLLAVASAASLALEASSVTTNFVRPLIEDSCLVRPLDFNINYHLNCPKQALPAGAMGVKGYPSLILEEALAIARFQPRNPAQCVRDGKGPGIYTPPTVARLYR